MYFLENFGGKEEEAKATIIKEKDTNKEKKGKKKICDIGFDNDIEKENTHSGYKNKSSSTIYLIAGNITYLIYITFAV